jgi:hypothetical protein
VADANADSWEHLQQWLEREVCALTDDADNTVLVEFVSAIDAHEVSDFNRLRRRIHPPLPCSLSDAIA